MYYAAMRKLDDRLEVLQYLLDRGYSVNDIMYQNCGDEYYFYMYSGIGAPLHYAAGRGLLDSVKLLVQHEASPQIRDPNCCWLGLEKWSHCCVWLPSFLVHRQRPRKQFPVHRCTWAPYQNCATGRGYHAKRFSAGLAIFTRNTTISVSLLTGIMCLFPRSPLPAELSFWRTDCMDARESISGWWPDSTSTRHSQRYAMAIPRGESISERSFQLSYAYM